MRVISISMNAWNNATLQPEDFDQFIQFGQIFDKPTRRYLVEYICHKIHPETFELGDFIFENYGFDYLRKSLDQLFENAPLITLAKQHENISRQIIQDTLKWMRRAYLKTQAASPYAEEKNQYNRWCDTPTFLWVQNWYYATNLLKEIYPAETLNVAFYEQKLEDLTRPIDAQALLRQAKPYTAELAALETVTEDLLAQWNALLTAKSLAFELAHWQKQFEEHQQWVEAKVEEFAKLSRIISPFIQDLGNYWDLQRKLWKNTGFDVLEQYAKLLHDEQNLQALADMLGKMRQAEIELDEEIYENVITHKTWVTDPQIRTEIDGIYESSELPKVLPSEISYLGYEATEAVFLKKYADQALLTWQYQGKKLVTSDQVYSIKQQKQKRKEKGPFIICIDTSGSMEGLPEQVAKTLCFAILKMAAQEHRKCFLISFSIGIQTINLLDLANSLDEVIRFLMMSFHGGTDATPALIAAIEMLQTNDYREADLLMVSDFVMFDLREEVKKLIRIQQQKNTQFHSLTITDETLPVFFESFDHHWVYRSDDKNVYKRLLNELRTII